MTPQQTEVEQPDSYAASVISGGAGKTQGVINLGVELASRGYPTVIWDMDPQRTASHILGYQDPPKGHPTIFEVLEGSKRLEEAIVPARYRVGEGDDDGAFRTIDNLELILGTPEMANAEVTLGSDPGGVLWLQNVIDEQLPPGRWKVMLFDCGPTLGVLLLSIALAVPRFIGCVSDEYKYILGLQDLEETLDKGRRKFRRFGFRAQVEHILATNIPLDKDGNVDRKRGAVTDDAIRTIRENEDWSSLLLPIIGRHIRFKDSIVRQQPVRFLAPNCPSLPHIGKVVDALGYPRLNSTRKR